MQGRWLAPHSHLDLIGSFTPAMREADDTCFAGARLFVDDTEEALQKSGDLLGPLSRGVFAADAVEATLQQLCRGERPADCGPGRPYGFQIGRHRVGRLGCCDAGVRGAGFQRLIGRLNDGMRNAGMDAQRSAAFLPR